MGLPIVWNPVLALCVALVSKVILSEAHALALARTPPEWLDVGWGQGGRKLLYELGRCHIQEDISLDPYLSFRMGLAISDAPLLSEDMPRLVAVEDYVGHGLLTCGGTPYAIRTIAVPKGAIRTGSKGTCREEFGYALDRRFRHRGACSR